MLWVQPVSGMDLEPSLFAFERQIFSYYQPAVVEENVMVRAQAEDVVRGARTVVRRAERPDMGSLSVRTRGRLQPDAAGLAAVIVERFYAPRRRRLPHDS